MNTLELLNFSINAASFQKNYEKIFSEENNIMYLTGFTEMHVSDIIDDNNSLLESLEHLKKKHEKIIPILNQVPLKMVTVINEFNIEEDVFGGKGSFQRIYEKCKIFSDAIIPALEKYDSEDILSAWKIMKSYADQEITTKKASNIEFFMPLLQHLYLHLLKDGITTKDDNEFMIQQKHIIHNHNINNIDIDMLELCRLYISNNNIANKEYNEQLAKVINHVDIMGKNSHDFDFTDFYSDGLESIFNDNNLIISKEIDKKVPHYFVTYQTEVEYRKLLEKIDVLNENLSTTNLQQYLQENNIADNDHSHALYLDKYLIEINLVLNQIKNNLSNTVSKYSHSFFNKEDKQQFVDCYQDFYLPCLKSLNEGNYAKSYELTTAYFQSNNNILNNENEYAVNKDILNLAFTSFVLNNKSIDSKAKKIVSSLIKAADIGDDTNSYLYELITLINDKKPINKSVKNLTDEDKNEYNFIIAKNIDILISPHHNLKPKF